MGFESIDQPGWSSEVECNPKMIISLFWVERGGRWGLSPLTSLADHQKLNIIQKWGFHFFGWRGLADGVWVHWAAWPTSDVECNTKTSISCFRLERGGWWGSSPSTSPANHQKFGIIQNQAFHFIGWRRVVDGVWVHWPVWPKSEVDCNTKMSISLFWLERGGRWGSSPLTSLADHQKLNKIQKWAFHFSTEEGWWMGFKSIDKPSWSSEVEHNPKSSISFFLAEEGW